MITLYYNFDSDEYKVFDIPLFDLDRSNFIPNATPYYRLVFTSTTGQIETWEKQDISEFADRYSQFVYNGDEGTEISSVLGVGFGKVDIYQWDEEENFSYLTTEKYQLLDSVKNNTPHITKYQNYDTTYKEYKYYDL